jgi:hypothetical protein
MQRRLTATEAMLQRTLEATEGDVRLRQAYELVAALEARIAELQGRLEALDATP